MALERIPLRLFWRSSPLARERLCFQCARALSTSTTNLSGHSKWSKIKHDKAQNDSRKSKARSIIARDLAQASKQFGPDPSRNEQLAALITKAKQAGTQKSVIEAAILRGQGKSTSGAALEFITVEAVVPPVAFIIEGETDRKTQLLSDVRVMLKSHGGSVTPTAYMFQRRGRIIFAPRDGVGDEDVLELALELGALEISPRDDGAIVVDTEPSALKSVETALSDRFKLGVESSETLWMPNDDTAVETLDEPAQAGFDELVGKLEDYPGVESIYTNFNEVRL